MFLFEETKDIHSVELPVGYCCYAGVELLFRKLSHYVDAVFVLNDFRVCPWVIHCHIHIVLSECLVYVYHLGVAHVRAVFFKGEAEDNQF